MTREEAIDILMDDAYLLYEDDRPYNREAYDMAVEALSDVPDTNVGKWISVKDRLPEHGTWAMWCSKDGKIQISRIKTEDAFIHFFPTAGACSFSFDEAVAWCPLPEPWKEEQQWNYQQRRS